MSSSYLSIYTGVITGDFFAIEVIIVLTDAIFCNIVRTGVLYYLGPFWRRYEKTIG